MMLYSSLDRGPDGGVEESHEVGWTETGWSISLFMILCDISLYRLN